MRKLLLIPAAVLVFISIGVFFLVLSLYPPYIAVIALAMLGLVLVWWKFGRPRTSGVPNSEAGIMGRQNSKEGLL